MDLWRYVRKQKPAMLDGMRAQFEAAQPFPHLIVDDFFTPEFFARLQQDFPGPGLGYDRFCIEDGGQVGTNYANGEVASFPPAFKELDALMQDAGFQRLVTAMTGVEQPEYDATYFGGGIRESRSGTFLPPHLDFNHHPLTKHHRRLNLLFYLNEDWKEEWGGNLQVHRDPTVFRSNDSLVHSYLPARNRCLVFETSETSWHGFDRLRLPPGMTRRAFTVYYYTRHRPDEAKIQLHNTEYVEPPLPAHLRPGHVLTEEDVTLLHEYITRRDDRIRMLYRLRMELDAKLRNATVFAFRTLAHRVLSRAKRAILRTPRAP